MENLDPKSIMIGNGTYQDQYVSVLLSLWLWSVVVLDETGGGVIAVIVVGVWLETGGATTVGVKREGLVGDF